MTIEQAKNIYCLGIGGIGVSGLARLLLSMGKNVSGSDIKESEITKNLEKLGIKIYIGQSEQDLVAANPDLIIYSSAVADFHWPASIAKLSQAQAVGELMSDKYGIGITGTNGKSTTSAILGLILDYAQLDPTVLIGSMLSPKNETEKFKANARLGGGKPARLNDVSRSGGYFVAESDEYARKMLENKPKMIIITNIAEDHLDYYKGLQDIKQAFSEYISSLPDDGILIYNADDHNTVEICQHAARHKFTFGIHHYADLQALNPRTESGTQIFDLHLDDEKIGTFKLHVPGLFNISNALGAVLAAIKLGVKTEVIQKTLEEYAGIWRRFEIVGKLSGKPVISDYAHHPAGVAATIEAAKQFYPGKKVLAVFQPHHRNRTRELFGEFIESLVMADELILPEIFDVAGREHGEDVSSFQLAAELKKRGVTATFAKDLSKTESLIREKAKNFDVILLMGAGDIDNLARKLVK
ncbi:MAG: UDP-N-acetylmuramate--L-alanine ligase [Candidatus Doudnabacteria bacterium]